MSDVAATTPVEAPVESEGEDMGRREFLNAIAGGAFAIAGLGAVVVTYRYFLPNALFEPSMSFRAGAPDLYPVDSVTYVADQQVYIVRTAEGFYAVSAICTHLGCNTQSRVPATAANLRATARKSRARRRDRFHTSRSHLRRMANCSSTSWKR
jgi:hypothetical protein